MSIYINAYSTVRAEVPFFTEQDEPDSSAARAAGPTTTRAFANADPQHPCPITPDIDPEVAERAREMWNDIGGFYNFAVEQGTGRAGDYTAEVHAVCKHILSSCRQYVFERPDSFQPEDLREFAAWAAQTNSIFFLPDGTIRNAEGLDLLDPELQQGDAPLLPPVLPAAVERMHRVRSVLWEEGIQVPPHVPPVRTEAELVLHTPAEIFQRAVTLILVGQVATAVLQGEAVDVQELRAQLPEPLADFTETEGEFLARVSKAARKRRGPSYTQDDRLKAEELQWSFVGAETLLWTLGLAEMDPMRLQLTDLPALLEAVQAASASGSENLHYRNLAELCEGWEATYSFSWYAVNELLQERVTADSRPLNNMDCSTAVERFRAFGWLTQVNAPYDEADISV